MRVYSYINSAKRILDSYGGNIPFSIWIKNYFKSNKQYGSSDRREISTICYSFFRTGNCLKHLSFEERIVHSLFLTETSSYTLNELRPEWAEKLKWELSEKSKFINFEFEKIFPFTTNISKEINSDLFNLSFLIQPDIFIRVRPFHIKNVLGTLNELKVSFKLVSNDCIQLPPAVKIDQFLKIDSEIVIQDYNSQKVLECLHLIFKKDDYFSVWDCCAASGGKSILLHDLFPHCTITVSDIRSSIIKNLIKRFGRAGINKFHHSVIDAADEKTISRQLFDLVICDAPCSGSGTWSRTPEQLSFFNEKKIIEYKLTQEKILSNIIKSVKKGGYIIYITCSVFEMENELVVRSLIEKTGCRLIQQRYYKGYEDKADTLFAALIKV